MDIKKTDMQIVNNLKKILETQQGAPSSATNTLTAKGELAQVQIQENKIAQTISTQLNNMNMHPDDLKSHGVSPEDVEVIIASTDVKQGRSFPKAGNNGNKPRGR